MNATNSTEEKKSNNSSQHFNKQTINDICDNITNRKCINKCLVHSIYKVYYYNNIVVAYIDSININISNLGSQ